MPSTGWWVEIEDSDTLATLSIEAQKRLNAVGYEGPVDRSHILGMERRITCTLADYLRNLTLFDNTKPLGVIWESKLGYGPNYALWLDDSAPSKLTPKQLGEGKFIAANDSDLRSVATSFAVRVH